MVLACLFCCCFVNVLVGLSVFLLACLRYMSVLLLVCQCWCVCVVVVGLSALLLACLCCGFVCVVVSMSVMSVMLFCLCCDGLSDLLLAGCQYCCWSVYVFVGCLSFWFVCAFISLGIAIVDLSVMFL